MTSSPSFSTTRLRAPSLPKSPTTSSPFSLSAFGATVRITLGLLGRIVRALAEGAYQVVTFALGQAKMQTTKRIWREWLTPLERQFIILSLFLIIVSSTLSLFLPKLAGQFLDRISFDDDEGALMTLIVCITLQQTLYGLASLCINFIGERSALRLRTRTFAALIRKPQSYFDATPRQKMLQATLADVDAVRAIISVEIGQLTERGVIVVGGFIAIMYVSKLLAFYTVVIAPVIAITLSMTGEKVVYPLEQDARDRIVDVSEAADESFSNSTIVRSFGMERAVANRFQIPALKRFLADRKAVLGLTVFRGAILYVAGMALLLACWYGRKMVRDHKTLQAGDLIAFLVYAVQIAVSMANSTRGLAVISIGLGCAKSTLSLLDEEERHDSFESELAVQIEASNVKPCEEIRFDNVMFAYPTEGRSNPVLKNINLSLKRGKSVALVGPSGAGKSSVIALMEKFYSPTTGKIWVDGQDLSSIPTKVWRNRIGLVTQDACLFAGSISENIALGKPDSVATKEEIEMAATLANVMEFARDLPLGLETQVGIRGTHLSSGQRQRVAVARAILRDPHVLLLDEHTSQLDTQSERLVQDSMDEMMKGRVTLIIAHRLQTARRANEICVLVQGKIVEQGTHDQLIEKPNGAYHGLWLAQQAKE